MAYSRSITYKWHTAQVLFFIAAIGQLAFFTDIHKLANPNSITITKECPLRTIISSIYAWPRYPFFFVTVTQWFRIPNLAFRALLRLSWFIEEMKWKESVRPSPRPRNRNHLLLNLICLIDKLNRTRFHLTYLLYLAWPNPKEKEHPRGRRVWVSGLFKSEPEMAEEKKVPFGPIQWRT
jgi:hypothetical protein